MIHVGTYPATVPMMQNAHTSHASMIAASPHEPAFQASPESVLSTLSNTFSAPPLPSSSSNMSTSTAAETGSTSPSSDNINFDQYKRLEIPTLHSPSQVRGVNGVARPPCIDPAFANVVHNKNPTPSPMALDSPVSHGFKRSADGSVKGVGLGIDNPSADAAIHKRNKSMDTHSGRIGELSAQLKTRLSYAMIKVQNGWEKQSLDELEEVHSLRGSPTTGPARNGRFAFDSPYAGYRRRRLSGVSENSDQMMKFTASDPTRSSAASPSAIWHQSTKPAMTAAANLISITGAQPGPSLAPAPEFSSNRRRRSSTPQAPPPLIGLGHRKHYSDLSGISRPPTTPRAGILRMPSQQAEKDAIDTLLFMSSPNNSHRFSQSSQVAPSPLRTEVPQRRVMFEVYSPQEKRIIYQPLPEPSRRQYGPYAAHPAS